MARTLKIAVVVTAVAALAAFGLLRLGGHETPIETYRVQPGLFEVTLTTEGDLEATSEHSVLAPFSGEVMRMLHVGERVEKGEIVLQMDTERATDNIESAESQLRELEANRIKVEESVSKQLNSAKLAIRKAEVELRLAKLSREEVEAGPTPEKLLDAERNLKSAAIIVANRTEELAILELLAKKGLVTGQEMEQKRLDLVQAMSSFEKASARHATVTAGSTRSQREDAALKLRIAEIELERARKHLESLQEVTKAQLEKAKIAEERQKRDLDEEREKLMKAEVAAPVAGIVQVRSRHRWRRWRPGSWVRERQRVLTIPAISRMKFTGRVDEDFVPLVKTGQDVRVRLPFMPGRIFKGKVTRCAPLGMDAHAHFGQYTKAKIGEAERQVFDVEMALEESDAELLPGLRAHAEIVVYRNENAVFVPASAVLRRDARDFVEVIGDAEHALRPVEAGRSNAVHVEVISGLSGGDVVALQAE